MTPDQELLRQYADEGSESAFVEVVRRHVDFVHSTARRIVAQDAPLAEDVTQRVFTALARKARVLARYQSLAAWLHRTTRYTAISAIRSEQRRRLREQEATAMQDTHSSPEISWEQLRPILDEAIDQLGVRDREVVLLRFFQGKSHREVGDTLGLSENSANKRVERSLEKLRDYFTARGVTASSAILAAAITANSVQAAPAGLAEMVTPPALMGGAAAEGLFFRSLFMSTKTKTLVAAALLLLVGGTITRPFWRAGPILPAPEPPSPSAASTAKRSPSQRVEAPRSPAAVPGSAMAPGGARATGPEPFPPDKIIKPVTMVQNNQRTDVDLGEIILTPYVTVPIMMPSGDTGTMMGKIGDDGLVHVYVNIPVPVPNGGIVMMHDESITANRGMSRAVFGEGSVNILYATALEGN